MLQYPTNVTPNSETVDANNSLSFSFTFNGYKMTRVALEITNISEDFSEGLWADGYGKTPRYYNGDLVDKTITSTLTNGNSFMYRYYLGQTNDDGSNQYDIYITQGKVIKNSGVNTIWVKDGIDAIYSFSNQKLRQPCRVTTNTGEQIIGYGMAIKIGDYMREIASYDIETGEITLVSPMPAQTSKDDTYRIYANYIITPNYFFTTRAKPIIDFTYNLSVESVKANGTYSQSENVPIKSYNYELSKIGYGKYTSGEIYSSRLDYKFYDIQPNASYTLKLTVKTQDNVEVSTYKTFSTPQTSVDSIITNSSTVLNKSYNAVTVTWDYDEDIINHIIADAEASGRAGSYSLIGSTVYRRDLTNNKVEYIKSLYNTNDYSTYSESFVDFKIQNQKSYEYIIYNRYLNYETNEMIYCHAYTTQPIEVMNTGYVISAIEPLISNTSESAYIRDKYGSQFDTYTVGETWYFNADIDNTNVAQNLDRKLHNGTSQYPIVSHGDSNYLSGTLSVEIGHIRCSDKMYVYDINLINSWRDFVYKNSRFLLKSQKGDLIIVEITDNVSVEYDESYYKVPTRISFAWTQVDDASKYLYGGVINAEVT